MHHVGCVAAPDTKGAQNEKKELLFEFIQKQKSIT